MTTKKACRAFDGGQLMYLHELIRELELIHAADWFLTGTAAGFGAAALIFCLTGGRKP